MINIIHTDNMNLMSRYHNDDFDLAIVDPEYGIGESGKNHKSRNTLVKQKGGKMRRCPSTNYQIKDWDDKPASPEYFAELKRVSKNQIIFGANYFESIMAPQKPPRRSDFNTFLEQYPKGFIIWDKVNGDSDFSDCEVIYTSFEFDSYVIQYMWAGMMQGVSIVSGTVMQGNKSLNEKRIHPTQKPVLIYKYLLERFAKPGYKILDTHLGSGSFAIACHDYGFDLTACERDSDYYGAAMHRIDQHRAQTSLFGEGVA